MTADEFALWLELIGTGTGIAGRYLATKPALPSFNGRVLDSSNIIVTLFFQDA